MKNRGLKNRFNQERLRAIWAFNYKCFWCDESGADCFHHIKSSSSPDFQEGKFNRSILNACPIHNEGCHLYNPKLHKPENEKMLLGKILNFLVETDVVFDDLDKEFFKVYKKEYGY